MKHLEQLKNLVIMAAADGSLAQSEIAMLVDRCAQLGLAEEDLEEAIDYALSDGAKMQLPTEHSQKIELLTDLMRIMAADGKLIEIEKRLFALAAAKMGIQQAELNQLIDRLVGPKSKA